MDILIKDNKVGNQSLHFDCNDTPSEEQFDMRTVCFATNAVVIMRHHCTYSNLAN